MRYIVTILSACFVFTRTLGQQQIKVNGYNSSFITPVANKPNQVIYRFTLNHEIFLGVEISELKLQIDSDSILFWLALRNLRLAVEGECRTILSTSRTNKGDIISFSEWFYSPFGVKEFVILADIAPNPFLGEYCFKLVDFYPKTSCQPVKQLIQPDPLRCITIKEHSTVDIKQEKHNIIVAPNPFTDYLTIHSDGMHTVKIVNIKGQTMYTGSCNNYCTINLHNMSSGIYILVYSDKENVYFKKIFKATY